MQPELSPDGRLYDGDMLDQVWPEARPLPPLRCWSEDDPRCRPRTGGISAGNDWPLLDADRRIYGYTRYWNSGTTTS